MSRIILFITNSREVPYEHSTIKTTINNYKSYFSTPYGGAWTVNEIYHLDQPDLQTLSDSLAIISEYQLCIIIFCGPVIASESTYELEINPNTRIHSRDIYSNKTSRYMIIIDNCYQINRENDIDFFDSFKPFKESLYAMLLNRWECKNYYETINTQQCTNQWVVVYSPNTPVSEYMGSYYAAFLLKQARLMISATYQAIDFKRNFGHITFPTLHKEVLSFLEYSDVFIPDLQIIQSENKTENSLVFGVLA